MVKIIFKGVKAYPAVNLNEPVIEKKIESGKKKNKTNQKKHETGNTSQNTAPRKRESDVNEKEREFDNRLKSELTTSMKLANLLKPALSALHTNRMEMVVFTKTTRKSPNR